MNVAIILAGGIGSRIGAGIPKQFIEVQGKPIIAYTLEKFQNNDNIDAIEIVCLKSHKDKIKQIVELYGINKVKWLTDGGNTFQDSVINGIFYLKDKISSNDIVLIHFAVSPMTSDMIIADAIRVCKIYGNGIPVNETVLCTGIKDDDYSSSKGIPRETIVGFNGPWTYNYQYLCEMYEEAIENDLLKDLDPHTTSLMYALGKTIYFSKSDNLNIKITLKEDLDLFEGYLLLQKKREIDCRKPEVVPCLHSKNLK